MKLQMFVKSSILSVPSSKSSEAIMNCLILFRKVMGSSLSANNNGGQLRKSLAMTRCGGELLRNRVMTENLSTN